MFGVKTLDKGIQEFAAAVQSAGEEPITTVAGGVEAAGESSCRCGTESDCCNATGEIGTTVGERTRGKSND